MRVIDLLVLVMVAGIGGGCIHMMLCKGDINGGNKIGIRSEEERIFFSN